MTYISRIASRGRDRGATAVVTALLLIGLVGFTGLAVDTGATMATQQELQNGADAAALAAAQECAENGCGSIDAVAGPYGVANVRNEKGEVSTTLQPDTGAQTVQATVSGRKTHWFLPVVGIASSNLEATATASWFTPKKGPSMLPLAISQCSFEYQASGAPVSVGDTIVVWIPKDNKHTPGCPDDAYPPGGFGWLDPVDGKCEADIIVGGWVGGDTGNTPKGACDFSEYVGKTVLIPIFNAKRGTGEAAEVFVTQFAAFEVDRLEIQTKGEWGNLPKCPKNPVPNGLHDTCLRGKFVEYVTSAEGYVGDSSESDVSVIRLID
ncbi:pilus assembly protein TadG-related protein [Ornithinimicrobium avium]|uniref:pilus assembly protein TadG-related protein n=1 Tax=Ornithinimicrobium avium TaxID=2283195 RepID=UPI0013B441FC|nr:pilus assembly protein TadG-related protein [Ornithinimicrobium avium]